MEPKERIKVEERGCQTGEPSDMHWTDSLQQEVYPPGAEPRSKRMARSKADAIRAAAKPEKRKRASQEDIPPRGSLAAKVAGTYEEPEKRKHRRRPKKDKEEPEAPRRRAPSPPESSTDTAKASLNLMDVSEQAKNDEIVIADHNRSGRPFCFACRKWAVSLDDQTTHTIVWGPKHTDASPRDPSNPLSQYPGHRGLARSSAGLGVRILWKHVQQARQALRSEDPSFCPENIAIHDQVWFKLHRTPPGATAEEVRKLMLETGWPAIPQRKHVSKGSATWFVPQIASHHNSVLSGARRFFT